MAFKLGTNSEKSSLKTNEYEFHVSYVFFEKSFSLYLKLIKYSLKWLLIKEFSSKTGPI